MKHFSLDLRSQFDKIVLGLVVESAQEACSYFPYYMSRNRVPKKICLTCNFSEPKAKTIVRSLDDETKGDFRMPDRACLSAFPDGLLQ